MIKNTIKEFLKNKSLTWLVLALITAGGIYSYLKMGKLEDAPFTIKQALVVTPYPGASPMEVQKQVTDILEESIQSLGELYYLKSDNRNGLSKITVYVKKEIRAKDMQQLWDKLRRKVNDVQSKLPDGAGPSVVNDDFGDVLGVFYGLSSETHSYREMEDVANDIKNELLKVKDVAKVELFGTQTRTVEINIDPVILSQGNVSVNEIKAAFDRHNRIVDAGALETSENRLRIEAAGPFSSVEEISRITVTTAGGEYFVLGDIAEIKESYSRPYKNQMKINGIPSIGIAISTVSDGNVVEMAELTAEKINELKQTLGDGYKLEEIYDQGKESAEANDGFVLNLIISVITVIAVLLFFIGTKNGILIGSGLVFSIFGTLIYMYATGIALQRMSLASIIIAMGMLVDNAIVVFDSTLVNMETGMRKRDAILKSVSVTSMPLLAATVIAIITFMPVYLSPHITGEILSSLFIVIAVSLLLSWVFAITQNVFFIQEFVKRPRRDEVKKDLFQGKAYDTLRKALAFSVRHKYGVILCMVVLLVLSVLGFRTLPNVFMPQLNKKYFTIDMWLPEGTRIEETARQTDRLVEFLYTKDISKVSSYVGQTPPRYYLANAAYGPQSNYSYLLIETDSPQKARKLQKELADPIMKMLPDAIVHVNKFELNTIPQALIEARFCGDDPKVLDSLTNIAVGIMKKNPKVLYPRNEWGNMAMYIETEYDPIKSGQLNIGRTDMMNSIKAMNDGTPVGVYRDNRYKVPVLLKTNDVEDPDINDLKDAQIWNGRNSAPLGQISGGIKTKWEWPLVRTYDRRLSMAAQCDVRQGYTMKEVHSEIREEIEAIELPEGYTFFWDSQFKDQKEAMEALTKYFPLAIIVLLVILVMLFKNFRQPLIIFMILPLSIIGMVLGLKITGFEFGFFCMAGLLGLLGMIIKNVIVLLDEVNIQMSNGRKPYTAIIEATVSRTRPVLMAAITTIFGSIPLLFDVVFGGMAATIVFGLSFATLLTLFVTPSLFAILYKVKPPQKKTDNESI